MTTKCYNCEKPAMFFVGPEGYKFALCLECTLKQQQLAAIRSDELEREINYFTAQMEAVMGMPGTFPRYPEREVKIIKGGSVTLNNITVKNSAIGVLNTGNLEIVDSAISALKSHPHTQTVAEAISKLTNAIADSSLPTAAKDEAIEILSTVATEATAPEGRKKSSVAKRLLSALPTLIQTSANAIEVWKTVEPIIRSVFN